jgi:hypothetical protein
MSINLSENDRRVLLEFQRAKFAFNAFPEVDKARTTYVEEKENLKTITDPAIAELVRRVSQEWLYDETYEDGRCVARGINRERADDISDAEKELYELSFQFGDNTIPNETDKIQ